MLVYFTLSLIALLGCCGLAIDVGRVELRTVQLQTAADAGAIAGAQELLHGTGNTSFVTAANADIATTETLNGIPATGSGSPVVAATYGPYNADYSTVQVTITQNLPTIFLGLINAASGSATITVKAVAQIPPCFWFSGNPPNTTSGLSVGYAVQSAGWDTSYSSPNWLCPTYSQIGIVNDYFAHILGSQVRSSAPVGSSYFSGATSSTPVTSVPLVSDPMSYLQANPPVRGACLNSSPLSYSTSVSLAPGTYCGLGSGSSPTPAVSIVGTYNSGHCTSTPSLTLSPGLYVFVGGFYAYCATVTGTGVTFYMTNSGTVNYGNFGFYTSTWNVSAPNDNSNNGVPGVSLLTDPNWTGTADDLNIMFTTWYGDGDIYSPRTGIYGWGTSFSAPNYLNIVSANMYSYAGEVRPAVNYASLPAGSPLHSTVTLVQ